MPRINKDQIVASGIVYKLHHRSKDLDNNFYIGSTVSEKDRRWKHKTACNNQNDPKYNYKVYQFIRENDGWNSWELEPIKKYFNVTIRQLERYEQQTRDELLPNLNNHKSGSGISHIYQIDQNEYNRQNMKQYYQENRDGILEKKRHKFTCDCGGSFASSNKSRHLKSKKHKNWEALQLVVD